MAQGPLIRKHAQVAMRAVTLCALVATLGACSSGTGLSLRDSDRVPDLMNIERGQRSPDEFAILPNKPIEIPEDLAALPAPTPGEADRVAPTPREDAVAALGGDPNRVVARGNAFPASDGALVGAASRFGVAEGIRGTLADADLEYRQRNDGRLLERLFNITVYYKAYRPLSLDKYAELERFRRAGIRTVAAPPDKREN
jgi:hypothetical protein